MPPDAPADCIEETRARSIVKTAISAAAGGALFFLAAHAITASPKQSLLLLALSTADGVVKTAGSYLYERKISHMAGGRNTGADRQRNPARDHFGRSVITAAGECLLSGSTDIAVAMIAMHDPIKALIFTGCRTPGRMLLSVGLKRAWAHYNWGVTVKPAAVTANPVPVRAIVTDDIDPLPQPTRGLLPTPRGLAAQMALD